MQVQLRGAVNVSSIIAVESVKSEIGRREIIKQIVGKKNGTCTFYQEKDKDSATLVQIVYLCFYP